MDTHPAFDHALQKSRGVKAARGTGGYQIRERSDGGEPRVVSGAGVYCLLEQRSREYRESSPAVNRAANRWLAADGDGRGIQECENSGVMLLWRRNDRHAAVVGNLRANHGGEPAVRGA